VTVNASLEIADFETYAESIAAVAPLFTTAGCAAIGTKSRFAPAMDVSLTFAA
jgi:hypothetical protein